MRLRARHGLRRRPSLPPPAAVDSLVDGLARAHDHLLHPELLGLEELHTVDRARVEGAALDVAGEEERGVGAEVRGPDAEVLRRGDGSVTDSWERK